MYPASQCAGVFGNNIIVYVDGNEVINIVDEDPYLGRTSGVLTEGSARIDKLPPTERAIPSALVTC